MKFLIDAQLPRRLALRLRALGHDALHTLDLPLANRTPDDAINALSLLEHRIVITQGRRFREFLPAFPSTLQTALHRHRQYHQHGTGIEQIIGGQQAARGTGIEQHPRQYQPLTLMIEGDLDKRQAVLQVDVHALCRMPSQQRSVMSSSARSVWATYSSRSGAAWCKRA